MIKIKNYLKDNIGFIIIAALFAFCLFYNLGDKMMWQDEAQTAVLAQGILQHGIITPIVGNNTVSIELHEVNSRGVWSFDSWGQYYLVALFFKIFGESTLAARLAFAIIAFLSVFIIKKMFDGLYRDKIITNLALILMLAGVVFLNHSRQCRYYAVLFFTMPYLVLLFYRLITEGLKPLEKILFIIFEVILFHFNYFSFIILNITFLVWLIRDMIVLKIGMQRLKDMIIIWATTAVFTIPWAIFINIFNKSERLSQPLFKLIFDTAYYITEANLFVPFILFIAIIIFLKRTNSFWHREKFLVFMLVFPFALLMLSPQKANRYFIGLLPIFYLLLAVFIEKLWRRRNKIMAVIVIILTLTTILSVIVPGVFIKNSFSENLAVSACNSSLKDETRCQLLYKDIADDYYFSVPIASFARGIFSKYNGPIEGITKYLNNHSKPGDVVFVNYDSSPLMFYTNLRVYNVPMQNISGITPSWIINRGDDVLPIMQEVIAKYSSQCNNSVITLPNPNQYWQDREGLLKHQYTTPVTKNNQTIIKTNC